MRLLPTVDYSSYVSYEGLHLKIKLKYTEKLDTVNPEIFTSI